MHTPVNSFQADLLSASDYYPFGMEMPERTFSTPEYRYGFNGKEKDDEAKLISGSFYDFGARVYDPRVGRFFSVDPKVKVYPWMSPYIFAANSPIIFIDENGEGPKDPSKKFNKKFKRWKKRKKKSLVGLRPDEIYEKYRDSKDWLGRKRGNRKWFKNYESGTSTSKTTDWDVEQKTEVVNEMGTTETETPSVGETFLRQDVDAGGSKGFIEIEYDMYGVEDRLQIVDKNSGEVIFDSNTLDEADENGKVKDKDGSGEKVEFDLGEGNTELEIIVNPDEEGKASTGSRFEVNLTIKTETGKKKVVSKVTNTEVKE